MAKKETTDISYEIVETLAVLTKNRSGWTRELNIISWNGKSPKYDIRDFSPDRQKISKGVTFTEPEMRDIVKAVEGRL